MQNGTYQNADYVTPYSSPRKAVLYVCEPNNRQLDRNHTSAGGREAIPLMFAIGEAVSKLLYAVERSRFSPQAKEGKRDS